MIKTKETVYKYVIRKLSDRMPYYKAKETIDIALMHVAVAIKNKNGEADIIWESMTGLPSEWLHEMVLIPYRVEE